MVYFARWKMALVGVICAFGIVFALPNIFNKEQIGWIPSWFPSEKMNLGLDLQGGSHLLFEVDVSSVIKERQQSLVDGLRAGLRGASPKISYRRLGNRGECAGFAALVQSDVARARKVVRKLDTNGLSRSLDINVDDLDITVCWTELGRKEIVTDSVERSIEIIRRRIDELGTKEPSIQRQGAERILVQVPGESDPQRIIDIIGKTAKMTFHLLDRNNSAATSCGSGQRRPPGTICLPEYRDKDLKEPNSTVAPVNYLVKKRAAVDGADLVDATGTFQDGRAVVQFRFNSLGARRFGRVTGANVGHPFAIVLDKEVISAPVINEPILGGNGIITGNFTIQSAQDLALLLRAGALPTKLTPIEQRTVGAELGADSIEAGKFASILSIILVIVFMGAAYGLFGLMADVALILNIILISAVLSLLQATLTLPGIAGIVLTIGMAVDANVLVFERIREEERNGRTPISAVDSGYQRALKTIIDANITTLIAAILLFQFGSGPIKGFAVTLAIGILTSMFTAIMVTRLMVVSWLHRRRPQKLPL